MTTDSSGNSKIFTSLAAANEPEQARIKRDLIYVYRQRPQTFQDFAAAAVVDRGVVEDRVSRAALSTWGLCDLATGRIPESVRVNAAEFIERDGAGFKLVIPAGEVEEPTVGLVRTELPTL